MFLKHLVRPGGAGLLAGLTTGGLFCAAELFVERAARGFLATGWSLGAVLPYYLVPAAAGGLVCAGWQVNLRSPGTPTASPDVFYNVGLLVAATVLAGVGLWGVLGMGRARRAGRFILVSGLVAVAVFGRIAISPPPLAHEAGAVPAGDRPNLLLITIDTLRNDHISAHGYPRATSPTLDRLAAEGVSFSQAVSQASITVRSMTSLFTSLLPSMHGSQAGLPEGAPDLFSTLREQGYLVAGFATENTAVYQNGIAEGLNYTDRCWNLASLTPVAVLARAHVLSPRRYNRLVVPPAGNVVVGKALAFASRHRDRPLVLWVHFMDVHSPYHSPAGYDNRFGPPLASGPGDDELNERLTRLTRQESDDFYKYLDARDFEGMERALDQRGNFTPEEVQRLIQLYDGGIAYADSQVDRLLHGLDRMGILANCLTAVTADHGEGFLEHGRVFHSGDLLYDELVRVPLILRRPGSLPAGSVVDTQVMVVDLFPTLLAQLGVAPPPGAEAFVGRDLGPLLAGADPAVLGENLALSEGSFVTSIRTPGEKYIDCPGHDRREFYDLGPDPGEQRNLYALAPDRVAPYAARVDTVLRRAADFITRHPPREASGIDDATRERLRALGYIQ